MKNVVLFQIILFKIDSIRNIITWYVKKRTNKVVYRQRNNNFQALRKNFFFVIIKGIFFSFFFSLSHFFGLILNHNCTVCVCVLCIMRTEKKAAKKERGQFLTNKANKENRTWEASWIARIARVARTLAVVLFWLKLLARYEGNMVEENRLLLF